MCVHSNICICMYVEREKVHSFPVFSLLSLYCNLLLGKYRYPRLCVCYLASYLKI